MATSQRKVEANRANALKSTGRGRGGGRPVRVPALRAGPPRRTRPAGGAATGVGAVAQFSLYKTKPAARRAVARRKARRRNRMRPPATGRTAQSGPQVKPRSHGSEMRGQGSGVRGFEVSRM